MKHLLLTVSVITICSSCVTSGPNKDDNICADSETGKRLYIIINGMPKIDSYPQYAEIEGARSAYYEWKTDFIKKHGMDSWQKFKLDVRTMHGEPKFGYEEILLDNHTM